MSTICRLAVYSGFSDPLTIACFASELELSFGGQGNGVYLSSSDKVIKGIDLSVTEIGRQTAKEEDFVLFHTRLASCGGVKDELCHPFDVEGDSGKYVVMHNGHWSDWWGYSDKEKSDTQTMSTLVAKYGIGVLLSDTAKGSGVWVVYDKDINRCYVLKRSGTFVLQRMQSAPNKSVFCHASEPTGVIEGWRKTLGNIHGDVIYELMPSGKARERRSYQVVVPEKKKVQTTYYGWSGRNASGSGWDYLHDKAYGLDGKEFNCYCRKDVVCWKCQTHMKDFGCFPMYDEDRWDDFLSRDDRLAFGLPIPGEEEDAVAEAEATDAKEDAELEAAEKSEESDIMDAAEEAALLDALLFGTCQTVSPDFYHCAIHDSPWPKGHDDCLRIEQLVAETAAERGEDSEEKLPPLGEGSWRCAEEFCAELTRGIYCSKHVRGDRKAGFKAPVGFKHGACRVCKEDVFVPEDVEEGTYVCTACRDDLAEIALWEPSTRMQGKELPVDQYEGYV